MRDPDSESFLTLFRATADSMVRLLAGHLKLARLELVDDASKIAARARIAAVFAVLMVIGYALLVLGIAAWLQPAMGWAVPLAMLGGLHFLGGGIGTFLALRNLAAPEFLPRTARVAAESIAALHPTEPPTLSLEQRHAV